MSFLLIGSEYITWWVYKLRLYFNDHEIDYLSRGAGYAFIALGILAFALFVRKNHKAAMSRVCFSVILAADSAAAALSFFSAHAAGTICFGLLMNLLHGAVGAYCLTRLIQAVPQQKSGIVLGGGCALGCVGTWVLSLPGQESFLSSPYVYVVYAVLTAAILLLEGKRAPEELLAEDKEIVRIGIKPFDIALMALVIVLISAVKCIGWFFNSVDPVYDVIRVEEMRLFYAVGLVAAGSISDKNRRWGAVCCAMALILPVLAMILRTEGIEDIGSTMWIVGYLCLGFYTMFRVLTFTDFAVRKGRLFFAGFGLMFALVGDSVGTCAGVALNLAFPLVIIVSVAMLALTILVFFMYYNKTYTVLPQEDNTEALLKRFEKDYELSARESDVFGLVANGRSNSEIAADLYIAESTVKFHVKNILRKTGCANRTELMTKFKRDQSTLSDIFM